MTKDTKKTTAAAKGRPKDSKNITTIAIAEPSRCPVCESTERAPYTNTTELDYAGMTSDGLPYTHVVWRSTHCLNCGQHRRDKALENRLNTACN